MWKRLEAKRILVVDDEPDKLAAVERALAMAHVVTTDSFHEARRLITEEFFDLAILDIMGVNGLLLLEVCLTHMVPVATWGAYPICMHTFHAAMELGAVVCIPFDALCRLPEIVAELLEDMKQGRLPWTRSLRRAGPFHRERSGVVRKGSEEGPELTYY